MTAAGTSSGRILCQHSMTVPRFRVALGTGSESRHHVQKLGRGRSSSFHLVAASSSSSRSCADAFFSLLAGAPQRLHLSKGASTRSEDVRSRACLLDLHI